MFAVVIRGPYANLFQNGIFYSGTVDCPSPETNIGERTLSTIRKISHMKTMLSASLKTYCRFLSCSAWSQPALQAATKMVATASGKNIW